MNNATALLLGALLVVGGITIYAVIDDVGSGPVTVIEEEQGVGEAIGEAIDKSNEDSGS